jgi:hypothetical protein
LGRNLVGRPDLGGDVQRIERLQPIPDRGRDVPLVRAGPIEGEEGVVVVDPVGAVEGLVDDLGHRPGVEVDVVAVRRPIDDDDDQAVVGHRDRVGAERDGPDRGAHEAGVDVIDAGPDHFIEVAIGRGVGAAGRGDSVGDLDGVGQFDQARRLIVGDLDRGLRARWVGLGVQVHAALGAGDHRLGPVEAAVQADAHQG